MKHGHEAWTLAERVAYLEGRLGTPLRGGYVVDESLDTWKTEHAWHLGRTDARDRRTMLMVKILFVLHTATAILAFGLIFSR